MRDRVRQICTEIQQQLLVLPDITAVAQATGTINRSLVEGEPPATMACEESPPTPRLPTLATAIRADALPDRPPDTG